MKVLGFKDQALDPEHVCTNTFSLFTFTSTCQNVKELLEFLKDAFSDQYSLISSCYLSVILLESVTLTFIAMRMTPRPICQLNLMEKIIWYNWRLAQIILKPQSGFIASYK